MVETQTIIMTDKLRGIRMDNIKYLLCVFFLSLIWTASFSQSPSNEAFTISGYVKDAASGEDIIGVTIYVEELKTGAVTNAYGFYSLSLPKGNYNLTYSFIGYRSEVFAIQLDKDITKNLELAEETYQMEEVVITSERPEQNVTEVKMSTEKLKIERIKSMPALFGEVDVLRSVQLLPGIQSAGEGTTGLFVRGGSADQTLLQMDEAPIYNPSHFLGFFSVFNPDAIKDLEVYKGGIPAKYGGRISSIMDIRMKEGNMKKFTASGGIGLISSRLTLEGPIAKDRASFIVSARRTYVDQFARFARDTSIRDNRVYFYDLNAKVNYKLNDNNKFFLSGYFGRDVLNLDDAGINWGNKTGTFRWNHLFNKRLFLNTTLIYSNFDYAFEITADPDSFDWVANLQEYNGKLDFTYFVNPKSQVDFGYQALYRRFEPAAFKPRGKNSNIEAFSFDKQYAFEQAAYISNQLKISDKFSMEYGLRWSIFQNIGPGSVFKYRDLENRTLDGIIDTVKYARNKVLKTYHGAEPRLGMRYLLDSESSLKASYNRTRQYLQIASNSTAGLPIDRWIPSDTYIKPQVSDQVALGYFRNFNENAFEFSAEIYYKWMQNQIDFKDGADPLLSRALETEILTGKGWSYGLELMLRKNFGRTTGWLSYTISNTRREVAGINGGKPYRPRYDRPHDISLVINHEINDRLSLSGNWVYQTGSAISIPKGKYNLEGKSIAYYDPLDRNGGRMPAYHRMDLSITLKQRKKLFGVGQGSWNFSIYNAYMKKNPWTISYKEVINGNPKIDVDDPKVAVRTREFRSVSTYLFRIVPSISYNFKF
ncbi:TonB-dependent receptor [Fulvivirgaceae bacterium BMA10]|uniref:TonB-dependent receptor n=1 Tax=Splendidivirga corallicola TaxID=3051826 RepID=A0ABT8KSX5_9BACT|nr:TonB-dependent receptor [Fulvivirgaceae bacterium BMA10]